MGADGDIFDFWLIGSASVAGSSVDGGYGGRCREFPAEGMLTTAAAYDEDVHRNSFDSQNATELN
jgi:hypothetical protein